jgi:23S rRNA (cytidine1920-2'-O)/16S rRNA (cytidine1409-2'-O)-methyltransferase
MTAAEKPRRQRLDALLVERGLAETRTKAQALIIAGKVFDGNGQRLDKPGMNIAGDRAVEVRGQDHPWVSRGGLKMAHALRVFSIDVSGKICLDVGASTGGFTDVLLAGGAAKVYAVDVGQGQLAWRLRQDPRVVVLERVNARHLTRAQVPDEIDLIVCDASFIGLETVLPTPMSFAAPARYAGADRRNSRSVRRGWAKAASCATPPCMKRSARAFPLGLRHSRAGR